MTQITKLSFLITNAKANDNVPAKYKAFIEVLSVLLGLFAT